MNHIMCHRLRPVILLVCVLSVWPASIEAAPAAKVIGRAVTSRISKAAGANVLRRDLARDAATRVTRLPRERLFFRYTTRSRGLAELRRGLAPSRHMSGNAGPGRPLSSAAAQRRFGLPARPETRLSVRLEKGWPVRFNRALAGTRGVGEVTSPKSIPASAITRVTRLQQP